MAVLQSGFVIKLGAVLILGIYTIQQFYFYGLTAREALYNAKLSETRLVTKENLVFKRNVLQKIFNFPFHATSGQQLCPLHTNLVGALEVKINEPTLAEISELHTNFKFGGHHKPSSCKSRSRVAILVPFRDRENHLNTFLRNLIPMLKRQQLEFNIFVIDQSSNNSIEPFNRGLLFNVGFAEANKRHQWDCFILHDVDLIPENDYNSYHCHAEPRHMSVAIDKYNYKLPYEAIFGGVSSLTKEHYMKINGFSNLFWGWGGEDDDLAARVRHHGLNISRPSLNVARYKMLSHKPAKGNLERFKILQGNKQRFNVDGLNNLQYEVEKIVLEPTHTRICVKLFKTS